MTGGLSMVVLLALVGGLVAGFAVVLPRLIERSLGTELREGRRARRASIRARAERRREVARLQRERIESQREAAGAGPMR